MSKFMLYNSLWLLMNLSMSIISWQWNLSKYVRILIISGSGNCHNIHNGKVFMQEYTYTTYYDVKIDVKIKETKHFIWYSLNSEWLIIYLALLCVLCSAGNKWINRKKLLQKSFTSSVSLRYRTAISSCRRWTKYCLNVCDFKCYSLTCLYT